MTNNQRQKRLERAQIRCMFQAPFFSPGVARLPVIFDDSVPTACTDGKEIRWGTKFFDHCKDHELVTVLVHEGSHCMFGHLWRFEFCDHDLANQACDHEINLTLKEFSAIQIAANKADPFPFPEPADSYLADPRYKGMCAEQIYQELLKQPKAPTGSNGKRGGKMVVAVGKASQIASNAQGGPSSQAHSMPSFGQFIPQAGSAQAKKDFNEWQNTLIQSVHMSKGQGNLPADLARMVDEIVNPKVPWPQLLRNWLREQCADDWSWAVPDLTMEGSGFILPSLRSEKMGPVVFGSDWSGSTHELISLFHAEKQAALDTLRPSKLIDIGFDTKVAWEKEYLPGDTISPEVKCGGGTCFKDFFRRLDEMSPAPKCAVVLTDMDGTMPDYAPNYPVIWCSTEKDRKAPFGTVVYVGE